MKDYEKIGIAYGLLVCIAFFWGNYTKDFLMMKILLVLPIFGSIGYFVLKYKKKVIKW